MLLAGNKCVTKHKQCVIVYNYKNIFDIKLQQNYVIYYNI